MTDEEIQQRHCVISAETLRRSTDLELDNWWEAQKAKALLATAPVIELTVHDLKDPHARPTEVAIPAMPPGETAIIRPRTP